MENGSSFSPTLFFIFFMLFMFFLLCLPGIITLIKRSKPHWEWDKSVFTLPNVCAQVSKETCQFVRDRKSSISQFKMTVTFSDGFRYYEYGRAYYELGCVVARAADKNAISQRAVKKHIEEVPKRMDKLNKKKK